MPHARITRREAQENPLNAAGTDHDRLRGE
jgi:hypothetical protein